MSRKSVVMAAALLAIGCFAVWSSGHAFSEEQSKPANDTANKSRLRTGKQAIEAALSEKTDVDVKEVPLEEVVRRFRMKNHVQIQFDMNALKDAAIDPAALPVTLQVKDLTLRSALKLILSQFNLTYIIQDEVLQITTKDKANTRLAAHVYDVRDVLPTGENNQVDFDSLMNLISTTIAVQSWSDVGGQGTIQALEPATLVVSQTDEVQEEIGLLLKALRHTIERLKAGKVEDSAVADASENEKAILRSLNASVDLDFNETPLSEVASQLHKQHQIEILFDVNALKDAAIDPTTLPVTYSIKGVSLRSALNGILGQFNLTWVLQDEVLEITTRDKASTMLQTRLYPIEDLVRRSGDSTDGSRAETTPSADSFVDVITSTVAMNTWSQVGGPGTVEPYDKDGLILVVSQTREAHEEIADLLAQLRELHRKQKDDDAKAEEKPQDPNVMVLQVYELRVSAPNAPAMTPQEVMEIVKGLVEPKGWGQGDAFIRGATGKLIVRQTPGVQAAVKKLLDEIGASIPKSNGFGSGGGRGRGAKPGNMPVVGANGGGGF